MEGLSVVNADLRVHIHPSQTKNLSQAIPRELSSLLFKYNDAFDGVLLAYNVNLPEKTGLILSSIHPVVAVRLAAKLLVFSPKPDMFLEGKVVKVCEESIHVIVLGFASVVITDEDIRDEFKFKTKHGQGLFVNRHDKHHAIKIGTMIRFTMKSMNEETMHIYGSLIPANTGSIKRLDKSSDHDQKSESHAINSSLKKRKEHQDAELTEHGSSVVKDNDSHHHRESKKSKKVTTH